MNLCVECRWCELSEDKRGRLRYVCRREDGRALGWDVIRKKACPSFSHQLPSAVWGA
ncbi:MAG: hypothetical protein KGO96_02210 [Elusimicrobia bacterium]|nr:hypothetical protein [Elusimicrobiota bacterium]MDE2236805.1 hypothetical protein [Elusimicrobiota bacterium]MDE2424710.1 hypothetical protein [Elusimicrobiota bacterium]